METGLKLDEVVLECPYCGTANRFNQGQNDKPCQYCHRGFFRRTCASW